MTGPVVFHLTTAAAWREAQGAGEYRAPSLDEVGFIHCSNLHQVERVARQRYAGTADLAVVALAAGRFGDEVLVDEPGDPGSSERFPHHYGAVPTAAALAVHPFTVTEPERCEQCGFDGADVWPAEATAGLETAGAGWAALSDRPRRWWRTRPSAGVWSPLEYAAHTRDVTALIGWGLGEVLAGRTLPGVSGLDPDEVAEAAGYHDQDPRVVMQELEGHLRRLVHRVETTAEPDWFRPASVDGQPTTALGLVRHAVHEHRHHLADVADSSRLTALDRAKRNESPGPARWR